MNDGLQDHKMQLQSQKKEYIDIIEKPIKSSPVFTLLKTFKT